MALRKVVQVIANIADQTIELIFDTGRKVDVKVNLCKIAYEPTNGWVYLYDSSTSNTAEGAQAYEPNVYPMIYSQVTNPVTANGLALYAAVLTRLAQASGGGGGDATAANQVKQINELKENSGEESVFKTAFDKSVFLSSSGDSAFFNSLGDSNAELLTSLLNAITAESGVPSVLKDYVDESVFTDFNNQSYFQDSSGGSVFKTAANASVFRNAGGGSFLADIKAGLYDGGGAAYLSYLVQMSIFPHSAKVEANDTVALAAAMESFTRASALRHIVSCSVVYDPVALEWNAFFVYKDI